MRRSILVPFLTLAVLASGLATAAAQGPKGFEGTPASITSIPLPRECPNEILSMAFGEGSLWMSCHTVGPIWQHQEAKTFRIDPGTHETLATFPICGRLAVGEGAIWLTEFPRFRKLYKIDPRTNQIVASLPLNLGEAGRIVVGEGGVWLSRQDLASIISGHGGGNHIVRVDPQTAQVTATLPVDHLVLDLAVGEGAVWILCGLNSLTTTQQEVWCLDPHTNQVVAKVPVSRWTRHLWAGEGWVWTLEYSTEFTGPPAVTVRRINPSTRRLEGGPIAMPRHGYWAAAVGLGSLWVSQYEERLPAALSRVNAQTGQVTVLPGGTTNQLPQAVVIGDQAVWVGSSTRLPVLDRVQP